jgi:hypothetical protein
MLGYSTAHAAGPLDAMDLVRRPFSRSVTAGVGVISIGARIVEQGRFPQSPDISSFVEQRPAVKGRRALME